MTYMIHGFTAGVFTSIMDFRRPTALLPGSQPFSKPHFCHGYPLSPDSHRGWPPLFDSNKTWQTRNDKQLTVILEKKHPKHYQLNLGVQKRNVNIISQILRWIILVPICPNTKRKRWVCGSKSHLFWSKPWPHGLEILRSRVAVNSPLSETCLLQKLAFFLLIESINIHTIL